MNPDLQFAELASFHWTISPLYRVDRTGVEPATPTLQGSVASWEHASPLSSEVRSGIEPDLPPYRGGVLPEHLQTIFIVIPDRVELSLSWLSPRRLCRWTTGSQVTEVGVEPTKSRGSRPRRFASLRTRSQAAGPGVAPGTAAQRWSSRLMRPG